MGEGNGAYGKVQSLDRLARNVSAHIPTMRFVEERLGRKLVDVFTELGLCVFLSIEVSDVVVTHVLDEFAHPLGLDLNG